ncbi:sulfotransferase [Microbulbifer sp. YPW1]|uniref:tetratricopeptide repeat-containing sulfotransferase family protein n=1 Tax=Microbulbifer sp. YPW1 TaxID=2745199 RepID=UPI0015976B0C|nr:sulfotransferase [Microbulbifer sp. YPW1]QKX16956.1 sulfotransferase [Microbulbifer sp. YPW1]
MQPKIEFSSEPSSEAKRAYTKARELFRKGKLAAAQDAAKAVIDCSPGFASGRRLYADILIGCGQFSAARDQLQQALGLFPESVERRRPIQLHLATAFVREGDLAGALRVLQSADLAPVEQLDLALLSQLGYLLTLCESHGSALQAFEAALRERPDDPLLLFNCAAANRAMGKLERAEALYDRVLALNPDDWEAYKNRSDLRKQTPDHNHVRELQQRLARADLPQVAKVQLHFALAKEYEDLGEYSASFDALQLGCGARRSGIDYELDRDLSVMQGITDAFDTNFLDQPSVPESLGQEIIFILGMPRTGSTLLDRVLCAAGDVVSAGEPDTFARTLLLEARRASEGRDGQNPILDAAGDLNIAEVGSAYVRQLKARAQLAGGRRIIDKNPMNFLYLGWIARALPGAKIVHLCRNPMDTCFAIYKTLFKSAYPFSYDQAEMAEYYCGYRKLMHHWKQIFPERVIDVHYERLVAELAREGRNLYQACDLAWSDGILDSYYRDHTGTATASAAQVRQPVYLTSVNKWQHYGKELIPMQEILRREGVDFDG